MKVAIVLITYNIDARLFLLQVECIRKFCKDDFSIEVFDNSSDPDYSEGIRYHCEQLDLSYRKTQSASRNGSESHSFAANLSYEVLKNRFEHFAYLDHDNLPIREFSVIDVLGNKIMAGLGQQGKKKFFWPGCVSFCTKDIDKDIIDFSYNHDLTLDTGGNLYKIIEKYGEGHFAFFNEVYCELEGFQGKQGYYSKINDGMFLHMIGGSNWENNDRHEERMNKLINIVKELTGL